MADPLRKEIERLAMLYERRAEKMRKLFEDTEMDEYFGWRGAWLAAADELTAALDSEEG